MKVKLLTKNILSIGSILLLFNSLLAQTSFQVTMDSQDVYLNDIVVNNKDEIIAFITEDRPEISDTFYIMPIDGQQNQITGWEVSYDPFITLYAVKKSIFFENSICFSHTPTASNSSFVSLFNVVNGQYWTKKIEVNISVYGACTDINKNLEVIIASFGQSSKSIFFKYDSDGNLIWKKGVLYKSTSPDLEVELIPTDIKYGPSENIYVIGKSREDNLSLDSYIIKMDSLGNILNTKIIEEYTMGRMVITEEGIYILNKGVLDFIWSVDPWAFDKAVLVKLDFDLNLLWAKQYKADQFVYSSANIKKTESGKLVMSHTTKGAFPAIFTEIDSEGNILSQKGYPNYRPDMELLSDGSLVLGSRFTFDETGQTFVQPLITKTDTNGEVAGCITYPTCLRVEDVEITMSTFEVDTVEVEEPEDYNLNIEPVTFSFSEGCNFPPVPIPDFQFPDTLCLSDSARTTDTYNRLANAFEWHLTGTGMDSINTDSFDFGFRFQQAGEYILKHTVWVLGCAYPFEKNITVLPELEVAIVPASLCPDEQELSVMSNRPLTSYEWGAGSISPTQSIANSGYYSVLVSDGYCSAADTQEVQLVTDLIGMGNPISLPPDTIICNALLPYVLSVGSDFTNAFSINGDSIFNGEYLLETAGSYSVYTELYGCPFSNTFHLETDDCQSAIFFPTIFSPNNDGINDVFFPQGKGFEAVSLQIFDRWGGMLYDGKGSYVSWSPTADVSQGMYAYMFFYENLLTGEVEQEVGEVVLVR